MNYFLLFLLLCFSFSIKANSANDANRPSKSVLAEDKAWLNLLHIEPHWLTGKPRSLIDSPDFFIASDGKYSPTHELKATISAFETDPQMVCRYPARLQFLQSQGLFESLNLDSCSELQNILAEVGQDSLVLVFSSAYLNNPSSMFGHTLLRLDSGDSKSRLLSYAINFAANTAEQTGLAFAIHGLTGGYQGKFSLVPYYEKVVSYNDGESRDLWEYELNLNSTEIRRLLYHVWELKDAWHDYYFLDENCSYQLLRLIEVARPGISLTKHFKAHAIPAETLKRVVNDNGLLKDIQFRPSLATKALNMAQTMSAVEQDLALTLVEDTEKIADTRYQALSGERKAKVIQLAHAIVDYRYHDGALEQPATIAYDLLREQARLPKTVESKIEPAYSSPHLAHGPMRIRLEHGHDLDSRQLLSIKASYHDLLDLSEGYIRGSAVDAFGISFRHDELGLHLASYEVLSVTSLTPYSKIFRPLSWHLNIGGKQAIERVDQPVINQIAGGFGLSGLFWQDRLNVYAFVEGQSRFHASLEKGMGLDAGLKTGLIYDFDDDNRLMLDAEWRQSVLYDEFEEKIVSLDFRRAVDKKLLALLSFSHVNNSLADWSSFSVGLQYYF